MAHWRPRVVFKERPELNLSPRRAPKPDSFVEQIVKYIPAESITAYQAIQGIASDDTGVMNLAAVVVWLVTPLWTFVATKDKAEPPAWHQVIVSFLAFGVWLGASDSSLIHLMIPTWKAKYGAVLLILATVIIFPLIGRAVDRYVD
jgi:hypothetical protein